MAEAEVHELGEDREDEVVDDESVEDDETLIDIGDSSLSYFGADFDVAGLVRRLGDGDIIIPRFDPDETQGATIPGFQRQRVWTHAKMEKFIESLLLGWPVPSIFLVVEPDQRYLVLDGQQRLSALRFFYDGKYPDGRDFQLADVAAHLKQATYETLNSESRRKLNNTFLQATVIEPLGEDGRESVYRLFGRLNSGGMALTPQEIRVALFRGKLIDGIRDLNRDENWRRLFGAPHRRLKDHEMILRGLVMQEVQAAVVAAGTDDDARRAAYKPPMSNALNGYLIAHRALEGLNFRALTTAFQRTCAQLVLAGGREEVRFNGRLNAAHIEALLAVLMQAEVAGAAPTVDHIKSGVKSLRKDKQYNDFVTRSTSHRESVLGRLRLATNALT